MPERRARALPGLLLAVLLAACGGGTDTAAPSPQPPQDCSIAAQREFVLGHMRERYLWNDRLGAPDEGAPDLNAYFASLLYRPHDRYSATQASASHHQLYDEGVRVGYGYTLAWDGGRLRVRQVEPASPLADAGLRRGDEILAIDGLTPQQVADGGLPAVHAPGVRRDFRIRDAGGGERALAVLSTAFPLQPLTHARIFREQRADGSRAVVGYLAYHQFVGYSLPALEEALHGFAEAGVDELVLDLRYNGGGSVSVSQRLASMIGGQRTAFRLFTYLRHNAGRVQNNLSFPFLEPGHPALPPTLPAFDRAVVIASESTASASELLINGLRPFMPVVLVGGTTFGKPYGSSPREYCGVVYSAIEFQVLNAQGEGGFTAGFAPDCEVADDLDHPLGDTRERRLAAALSYLREGRCPQAPASAAARQAPVRTAPLGEITPPQLINDK